MRTVCKILLPFIVLALGAWGAWEVIESRPAPKKRTRPKNAPLVRVVKAKKTDVRLVVRTQGTVRPRTETALVPEISGRVVNVSPSLAAGGFFDKGQVLIKIDRRDYELAITQAEGNVAKARLGLAQCRAEAGVARREWNMLGKGEASDLALKQPQLAEGQAAVKAAQATLEQARLNLSRTVIKAPFAGRVREENIDVGQYVTKGNKVAVIYAVDYAEVRLPLPDSQLAYVDLPLVYRNGNESQSQPEVILRAKFAGREFEWTGKVVRTEGEIDPVTRMVYAVAQVKNPYGRGNSPNRPPLAVGMFVNAEIQGRLLKEAFVLPREALRGRNQVLVIDKKNRIHFRTVDVLRVDRDQVIIKGGLKPGERVSVTQPEAMVEGMKVRVSSPKGAAPKKPPAQDKKK